MYAYSMNPCNVAVRCLDTIPAVALQHPHRHTHQTLRHHFRREIRMHPKIAHRHIDNAIRLAFKPGLIRKHLQTIHHRISLLLQTIQQSLLCLCRGGDTTQHHILSGERVIYIKQSHALIRCKLLFQTVRELRHFCRDCTVSYFRSDSKKRD